MIVRQLGVRQSRQFLAFTHQARNLSRRFSTQVETNVQSHPGGPETRTESTSKLIDVSEEEKQSSHSAWRKLQAVSRYYESHGSVMKDVYDPNDVIRNPPTAADVTLEMLLASQTHLGHSTSRWNPQNSRYIFGIREGIHIISLDQTAAYLRRAAKVVEELAARGGLILFVGTRPGAKDGVVRAAELAGACHVFERWVPGALTNGEQILGHCERMVVNAFDEELPNFKATLVDRPVLRPDLVICLNPVENKPLLQECAQHTIPTIGIIDTDADPTSVTYQIPANDDSMRSTNLIAGVLGRAGEAGQQRRLAMARKEMLSYTPVTADELLTNPLTGGKDKN